MNNQICDVNGKEIKEGASIVYAVRDGSCMTALRKGTVFSVESRDARGGWPEYFIGVVTDAGRHVMLSYPERIAVIA